MKHDDPLADNLLARLFSYTPREGREPFEDFCTETLAWCLVENAAFCSGFLKLLRKLKGLSHYKSGVYVDTQEIQLGKRFDIVIRSSDNQDFVIVVEDKVWSDFGPGQLAEYRNVIQKTADFKEFKNRYLVSLTPSAEIADGVHDHIKWSDVQKLLSEFVESNRASRKANPKTTEFQTVSSWFAGFLAQQGLAPMKIKTKPQNVAIYLKGLKLKEDLESLLNGLRQCKRIAPLLRKKQVRFETQKDTWSLGIFGNEIPELWLGFNFVGVRTTHPQISVHVERNFTGNRGEEKLKREFSSHLNRLSARGQKLQGNPGAEYAKKYDATWLWFEKALGPEFCDGDQIRDWFVDTVIAIKKFKCIG